MATTTARRTGAWTPWLYLAPALLLLGGLLVYPVWQLGLISFLEYTQAQVSGGEPTTFQGLGNYATLFADEQFWQVLLATVLFAAACVVSTLAVGCALAVLLTRVRALPRLALMLAALGAWATPAVTGSTVWMFLFDPDFGPVNRVFGLGDFSWTYGRYSAFALVLLEVVWCSFPFVMITVYAGIRAVPAEVVEAAALDGASQWRIWRSVLAPMLRPILLVVTVQSVIWDFKVFTQIYVMTNGGGIAGQNLVLNVYAYQKAFASSQYGLGSAIGVVMLLILLAVTLGYLRILRRRGGAVNPVRVRVRRPWRLAAEASALLIALVVAFPLYWMVLGAFKPAGEIESTEPRPWTLAPSLDSFRRVFQQEEFGRYFVNSLIVAGTVVVVSALVAFLAATAVTRFRFRFRTTLLIMFLVAQMVPVEALTIPLFFLMRDFGQLNTLGSLILPHLAFSLPFAVWMLRGFVKAVPEALEEAAYIDGASRTRFLWQILFPLVFPGLVATSVFSFISTWNDFLFAKSFIISDTSQSTLPMALLVFFKPDENDWGGIMAASTVMTIPVLVFFVLVQRRLVSGLGGAVKD